MKNLIVCSFFLFISAFANAQISIMPYAQSDLAHFATFPNSENQFRAYNHRKRTQPKLAYTFGIAANYAFNEKWELKTGLEFQEMGHRRILTNFFDPSPIVEWYQPVDKIKQIQANRFINVPLQVQYNFVNDKKSTPFIAFGTSLNWNFSNQTLTNAYYEKELIAKEKYNSKEIDSYQPQKLNLSLNIDVGFQRQLTEKLTLNTFLSGNMLGLPMLKTDIYNSRYFNIGFGMGLAYSI